MAQKNTRINSAMPLLNTKKKSEAWTILSILLLVVLFALAYKFKDMMRTNTDVVVALDNSCDLRVGVCISKLPSGGTVSFSISPNHIPLLSPLELKVKIEGVEATVVDVEFIGIGMDMGFNRTRLVAGQGVNKNQYIGKGTLPVCLRSKMNWEARVILNAHKGTIAVPFRFFTNK